MTTPEPVRDRIRRTLEDALAPSRLEVIDESHLHRGHGGWRDGGETHFRVRIASPTLAALPRLARHRRINELLAEELRTGVHALAIEAE